MGFTGKVRTYGMRHRLNTDTHTHRPRFPEEHFDVFLFTAIYFAIFPVW